MYRLFNTHNVRKTIELSALWDFEAADANYKGKITVPSCWECIPELVRYKGKAVYTKNAEFGGTVRFVFKGVITLLMYTWMASTLNITTTLTPPSAWM